MLPMSVNRLDIDIATAEISKPSLIGFDVGESASYSLGFLWTRVLGLRPTMTIMGSGIPMGKAFNEKGQK